MSAQPTPGHTTTSRQLAQLRAQNALLVDALTSMLNLEYAAQIGAANLATTWPGESLDVLYHCEKARAALRAARQEG